MRGRGRVHLFGSELIILNLELLNLYPILPVFLLRRFEQFLVFFDQMIGVIVLGRRVLLHQRLDTNLPHRAVIVLKQIDYVVIAHRRAHRACSVTTNHNGIHSQSVHDHKNRVQTAVIVDVQSDAVDIT